MREPDFNKWTQLAGSEHPAASLSAVTAGDLDRSLRQREIRRPGGFADELRAVLTSGTGAWGALTVFREARSPHFSPADVQFVSSMAGLIADGLRFGLLLDAARDGADDVGLLMLDADDEVTSPTPPPTGGSTTWVRATGRAPACRWWCLPSPARPGPSTRPRPEPAPAPVPAGGWSSGRR